jgi:hypothetical protein
VQGFTVGPTPKPFDRFKSIRFSRYDFPVRYKPATEITPIGPGTDFMKERAYYSNVYFPVLWLTDIIGIAFSL